MSEPQHARPRVLLSSVFGPFSRDDEFGSRAINPLELYHNQVTRAQGPFSLRMHHRSWGIMLIQANIGCVSTVLDFQTRERFIDELKAHQRGSSFGTVMSERRLRHGAYHLTIAVRSRSDGVGHYRGRIARRRRGHGALFQVSENRWMTRRNPLTHARCACC